MASDEVEIVASLPPRFFAVDFDRDGGSQ